MALNSESVLMEPEAIVLYNDPLLFSAEESNQNECSLVFKTINSDIITNSTLVFDPNVYHMDSELTENFSSRNRLNIGDGISFHFENDPINTGNNLNMNFFYKNPPKDQPEFVDVNNLTGSEYVESKGSANESFVVSDDENDVIFVKEYKKEDNKKDIVSLKKKDDAKEEGIRRNPVRKARINKGRRHLQKEHLLEEDFAFLDQIDDDNLVFSQSKSSSSTTSTASSVSENCIKEWPINCYERPEFNSHTNKIEPFDFTIREIQNNQQKKKPRLETCTAVKRKPKKKYFIRKRKPKAKKAEKKISVNELKEVIYSTFELVGGFMQILVDNDRKKMVCNDGLYDLLKNQTMLMAVVNDYGEKEITKCVSQLLGDHWC